MIDISVVIVNYKSWNALRECLEAITAINNNTFILETIVVDNHSNDGEINHFKNIFPNVISSVVNISPTIFSFNIISNPYIEWFIFI